MLHQVSERGPWQCTSLGGAFYLGDPRVEEVRLEDIARGLSRAQRFAGQFARIDTTYSVAEHSWLGAQYAREYYHKYNQDHANFLAYWLLWHDAEEAYTGDFPVQIKEIVPELRERICRPIERVVLKAAGLGVDEKPPEVKEIDMILCATEKRDLMAQNPMWTPGSWQDLPYPAPFHCREWSPAVAEYHWLAMHRYLEPKVRSQLNYDR